MTREEQIEKIKKLLALAASSNENEAKLAMSRAQTLLTKYCIEQHELVNEAETTVVTEDWNIDRFMLIGGLLPRIPHIASIVSKLFGCMALIYTSQGFIAITAKIEIVGFPTNIELTKYALDAIMEQALIAYRESYGKYRSIAFGDGFWNGFIDTLHARFGKDTETEELGLVVYDKVKEFLAKRDISYMRFDSSNETFGKEAGIKAAQEVRIHKAVKTGRGNLIG